VHWKEELSDKVSNTTTKGSQDYSKIQKKLGIGSLLHHRSKTIPACDQVSRLSCCALAVGSLGNKVPSIPTVGKAEELLLYHIRCSYWESRKQCVKGGDPGVHVCCRWQLQLGQSCSVAWRSAPHEPCLALGGIRDVSQGRIWLRGFSSCIVKTTRQFST